MSLTIKHLNADASFLLSFQPILPQPPTAENAPPPFTIVLDPWLDGPSEQYHRKFSISSHVQPSCLSSLRELPEPDLVIISQDRTDHCHKETLKTLPAKGSKTVILAEPAAAKTIRSWKYFSQSHVKTLNAYTNPIKSSQNDNIYRIPVPAAVPNGAPGEVTVAFIRQKRGNVIENLTGLHSAIGITYRPPTSGPAPDLIDNNLPPTPPQTPTSRRNSRRSTFSAAVEDRTLSVLFSPHGCSYDDIAPYASSHLVSEAALPLTALLHSFHRVTNPWWLGGNICAGFPGGLEVAQKLLPQAWVSAHDEDKKIGGFVKGKIVTRRYEREEIEEVVSPRSEKFKRPRLGTDAVVLGVGEETTLSRCERFGGGCN